MRPFFVFVAVVCALGFLNPHSPYVEGISSWVKLAQFLTAAFSAAAASK